MSDRCPRTAGESMPAPASAYTLAASRTGGMPGSAVLCGRGSAVAVGAGEAVTVGVGVLVGFVVAEHAASSTRRATPLGTVRLFTVPFTVSAYWSWGGKGSAQRLAFVRVPATH